MLKKIIAVALVLSVTAAASIAGTVAYLTADDSDVNVMTLGNVKIQQIEQERDENGELQDFTQAKPAYPAVGPVEWADTGVTVNETEYKVFTDELKNVVDKIVTVKNTGLSEAYVRTLIAIEAPEGFNDDLVHVNVNQDEGITQSAWEYITVNGIRYVYTCFTYAEPLKAGETSAPSLLQVFLDSQTTNEDCEKLGDEWDIRVISQAVQTQGFDDTATALDTGFGVPMADNEDGTMKNVEEWFSNMSEPILVTGDPQSLKDAMLTRGAHIVLTEDIVVDAATPLQYGSYMFLANGREVTIDLNGHDIIVAEDASTSILYMFTTANGGTLNIVGEGNLTAKNQATGICWAMNKNDQINIYGGTYSVNGDNWSDDQAILYATSGSIDVYGGKFYGTGHWISNVADGQGDRVCIVFHEGALFETDDIQQGDSARIKLEEGCVKQSVEIDGKTWYQVVKE